MPKTALVIVDVQSDFLPPNGALAVPNGRDILPVLNNLLKGQYDWDVVIASQVSFPDTYS